jgi:hypothetical protein
MKDLIRQNHFAFAALGLVLIYWLVEAVIDAFVFHTGTFAAQLVAIGDPNEFWMRTLACILFLLFGLYAQYMSDKQRLFEMHRLDMVVRLETSRQELEVLRRLLPICAHCKKIRDDRGFWEAVEGYFAKHNGVDFTHSICPDCLQKHYPEFASRVTDLQVGSLGGSLAAGYDDRTGK